MRAKKGVDDELILGLVGTAGFCEISLSMFFNVTLGIVVSFEPGVEDGGFVLANAILICM